MLMHLCVKVVLLLVYLFFLAVLLRLLDLSAWYETGFLAAQLVDPLSLSVRKLKLLLDGRGLSYEGILEKEELVALAEGSGEVAEADLSLLELKSKSSLKQQKTVEFSGRAHFLEEVEDKKDSVWLIQVVPGATLPLLGSSVWKGVVRRVSAFGIRTGIFVCARDLRFCRSKRWTLKPFVLLAMPDGHQYKDHVVSQQLYTASRVSGVVDWVNDQLSSKLMEIESQEELCDHWLEYKSDEETSQNVRAVVFTPYKKPSVLYSALSSQYSGRVKFGFFRGKTAKCINFKPDSKTHLVISTASGRHKYDLRSPGEFLNMDAINLYFHTLVPEINDVFIISFVTVNLFCFMDLFLTSGGLAKIFLCFFWQLAKLNLLLILLWLPLLWLFQLSLLAPLSNFFWWGAQVLCQTSYVGQLRQDWLMYSHHWGAACGFFTLYCVVFGWFVKQCRPQSQEDNLSSLEWIRLVFHQLHLFMVRPRSTSLNHGGPQISTHLEEGLDLFVDRPTPDLWLHPVITGEYIHNLPRWKYGGFQKPHKNYTPDDLCNRCQASVWKVFSCAKPNNDHHKRSRDMFVKSCKQIQVMFSDRTDLKPSCCKGVEDLGMGTDWGGGLKFDLGEDSVVLKQPMGYSKKANESANLAGINSFCQDCFDVICKVGEAADWGRESSFSSPVLVSSDVSTNSSVPPDGDDLDPWPEEILQSSECAICLEAYSLGVHLCGLPCGHAFHFGCVQVWLCGGKHCCPTCRWPAFKRKPSKLSKYKE